MRDNKFTKTLEQVNRGLKRAEDKASFITDLYKFGKYEEAMEEVFRLAIDLERTVLLSRALPEYTGYRYARQRVEQIMEKAISVEIGYTAEGWFSLRMPALLPKKGAGGVEYIRQFLFPAVRKFFSDKYQTHLEDAVMIFRHVYPADRPERQMRDHDNIEVNAVSDIVALFVLRDDSPKYCSHYYCSAKSTSERTEVYVVPRGEFANWLAAEKSMPDKGVILYENVP